MREISRHVVIASIVYHSIVDEEGRVGDISGSASPGRCLYLAMHITNTFKTRKVFFFFEKDPMRLEIPFPVDGEQHS